MTEHDPTQDAGSGASKDDGSSSRAREAAWDDVATNFSNLGKQVRKRFERPGETPPAETPPPGTSTGETPAPRDTPGGDTVRRWIDTLDDTFTKLGETVRDPEFRREAGSSVGQLGEALGVTLREFGDQLQGRFGRTRTEPATGEDMPDVPPPPPASPPPSSSTPPASTPPASTPPASDTPPPPSPTPPKPDASAPDEPPADEPPPA